jgi:hypothetical protein
VFTDDVFLDLPTPEGRGTQQGIDTFMTSRTGTAITTRPTRRLTAAGASRR